MTLDNVVPWGRSFEEYRRMFSLNDEDMRRTILGCGDGPSSFNAEMNGQSGSVVSIDPLYRFSKEQIHQRILETAEHVLAQVEQNKEHFVWKTIRSMNELETIRMDAMAKFLDDFECGKEEKRYIEASLPDLPFEEGSFDLVVCSHFLLLYSAHLDWEFHLTSVLEMCRVGDEVRIFPLVDLCGDVSVHLIPLMAELEAKGYDCRIETVEYEFQKGGNKMLRIETRGGRDAYHL